MEKLEAQIKGCLMGQKLGTVNFLNINDSFFVFDPQSTWVFDAGVQLVTDAGSIVLAWDQANDGFFYTLEGGPEALLEGADFYTVESDVTQVIQDLSDKEITSVDLKFDFYQEYDENAQLKEEKNYVPIEIKIHLEGDNTIQIALIDFGVNPETKQIGIAQYDLFGRLFVSLNKELEIKTRDSLA